MSDTELEGLLEKVRSLFQHTYDRGAKDALKRIVDVAQGSAKTRGPKTGKKAQSKERAPNGSARALVERILSETGSAGANASQIVAGAKSSTEKLLSYSAIRLELHRGQKERRYRVAKGKWSLSKHS
jgi:hypothetical protein